VGRGAGVTCFIVLTATDLAVDFPAPIVFHFRVDPNSVKINKLDTDVLCGPRNLGVNLRHTKLVSPTQPTSQPPTWGTEESCWDALHTRGLSCTPWPTARFLLLCYVTTECQHPSHDEKNFLSWQSCQLLCTQHSIRKRTLARCLR
jgi:hypothetical protein